MEISKIRIFFRDGSCVDIKADAIEINRLVDEILINRDGQTVARFFTHQIAGYLKFYNTAAVMACGED